MTENVHDIGECRDGLEAGQEATRNDIAEIQATVAQLLEMIAQMEQKVRRAMGQAD